MALIPFPDVPNLPGVPALPRQSNPAPQIQTVASTPTPVTAQAEWQITNSNGVVLITPDSVIEFEYRGEMKVADYPVESGSFSSYNKVVVPFDIRMTISCGGHLAMTRQAFLGTIEALRLSLEMIAIVTPDSVYQNCNLVHVDFSRKSSQGVSLILAQLWLQEIRTVGGSATTTAQPDGAPSQPNGQVSPSAPNAKQQAHYDVQVSFPGQ